MNDNSIVGRRNEDGTYSYKLLEKDIPNLPTEDIPTGSTAYIIDNADILMYEKTMGQWFAQ